MNDPPSLSLLEAVADRLDLESDHLRVKEMDLLRWLVIRIADAGNDEPLSDQLAEIAAWVPDLDLPAIFAEERARLAAASGD